MRRSSSTMPTRPPKDADVNVTFSDAVYAVSGSGDHRNVTVSAFKLTATSQGEDVSAEFKDGCVVVTIPDSDPIDSCKDGGDIFKTLGDAGVNEDDIDPSIKKLVTTVQDAFADFKAPGIAVSEVDGKWYVSPIATGIRLHQRRARRTRQGRVAGHHRRREEHQRVLVGAADHHERQPVRHDPRRHRRHGAQHRRDDPRRDVPDITVPDITIPDFTIPDTFPTSGGTLTVDDFRDDTESFITGSEVAAQTGVTIISADCDTPSSTAVGTTYTCIAWDDAATKYTVGVVITSADGFTVESFQPA